MRLKFMRKEHEIGNIWSFFFESEELTNWQPGEYFNLTMPDVPPVFAERLFSISSAPHEKHIRVTTWITPSPFKQKLITLSKGDILGADQLGGDFTLDPAHLNPAAPQTGKRLFLAGGIGITPYRSMMVDAIHRQTPLNTILLWSGKVDGRPFVDEINGLAKRDPTLKVQHFVAERLNVEKIRSAAPDIKERVIYMAGSQPFVDGLGEQLMSSGISRSQLKYDWFDGYTEDIQ
jgi:ferredoxin-NADP reductase